MLENDMKMKCANCYCFNGEENDGYQSVMIEKQMCMKMVWLSQMF